MHMNSKIAGAFSRDSKLRWVARAFCSGVWIVVFWALWGSVERIMGRSKWPDAAQAIFMGAVSGTAFSVATYVDRKILGYEGAITKFSAARLTAISIFV